MVYFDIIEHEIRLSLMYYYLISIAINFQNIVTIQKIKHLFQNVKKCVLIESFSFQHQDMTFIF